VNGWILHLVGDGDNEREKKEMKEIIIIIF
jgi:hypothetical protein